jgi:hypothetical protein
LSKRGSGRSGRPDPGTPSFDGGEERRRAEELAAELAAELEREEASSARGERVAAAMRLLSLRVPPPEIQRRLAEKYEVVQRTIRADIRQARRLMAKQADAKDLPLRRLQYRAGLELTLQQAMAAGKYQSVLGALDRLAQIDGVLDDDGRATTGGPEGELARKARSMTTAERRRRLEQLLSAAAKRRDEAAEPGEPPLDLGRE